VSPYLQDLSLVNTAHKKQARCKKNGPIHAAGEGRRT